MYGTLATGEVSLERSQFQMKRTHGIWILVFVVGMFFTHANIGWGEETPSGKKNAPTTSKEKTKNDAQQQQAASNCPPGLNGQLPSSSEQAAGIDNQTTGRRDQAVGNDSPLTKNSNKEIEADHFPCPPADPENGSSVGKGGASSGKSGSSSQKPESSTGKGTDQKQNDSPEKAK